MVSSHLWRATWHFRVGFVWSVVICGGQLGISGWVLYGQQSSVEGNLAFQGGFYMESSHLWRATWHVSVFCIDSGHLWQRACDMCKNKVCSTDSAFTLVSGCRQLTSPHQVLSPHSEQHHRHVNILPLVCTHCHVTTYLHKHSTPLGMQPCSCCLLWLWYNLHVMPCAILNMQYIVNIVVV